MRLYDKRLLSRSEDSFLHRERSYLLQSCIANDRLTWWNIGAALLRRYAIE